MKTDAYTKIVLTVIACTLLVFVFQNTFGAKASFGQNQSGPIKVTTCDSSGLRCAGTSRLYASSSHGLDVVHYRPGG